MVVKKRQSMTQNKPNQNREHEERVSSPWTVKSITIHAADQERKEHNK
jgi:hypothetical protein